MKAIVDDTFGELTFDGVWKKELVFTLFGVTNEVEVLIEGNDIAETIRDEQRQAYREFNSDHAKFAEIIEDSIRQYARNIDLETPPSDLSKIATMVKLTGIVFPMVLNKGDLTIGFLMECKWSHEHGLAVRIRNGEIKVGTQDLLT